MGWVKRTRVRPMKQSGPRHEQSELSLVDTSLTRTVASPVKGPVHRVRLSRDETEVSPPRPDLWVPGERLGIKAAG